MKRAMTSRYRIVKYLHRGSEYKPYIVKDGVPIVLPSLWALTTGAPLNTLEGYLRDIKIIYEWAENHSFSLERAFSRLEGFTHKKLDSLAVALCTAGEKKQASAATCLRRKHSATTFLWFCFLYFIGHRGLSLSDQAQAEKIAARVIEKLKKNINKASNYCPDPRISTALSLDELKILESVFRPDSSLNPFKSTAIQWRNYCIYRTSLETLARRSELVLLELDDIDLGVQPSVTIKVPSKTNKTKRKDGASLKTNSRTIPISDELSFIIYTYLNDFREELLVSKRPSSSLFISGKDGRRLSSYSVNSIFEKVQLEAKKIGFCSRLHPHGMRSTAANIARAKLLANPATTKIDVAESLAYLGGWTQGSEQVRHYTKKTISEQLGVALRGESKRLPEA